MRNLCKRLSENPWSRLSESADLRLMEDSCLRLWPLDEATELGFLMAHSDSSQDRDRPRVIACWLLITRY